MLEYGLRLVGLHAVRHHIVDIHDDTGAQLQIVLTFDALFGYGLRNVLAVAAFELSRQQVA